MNDEDFLQKVYRLGVWLWVSGLVALAAAVGWLAAAGWTLGSALSLVVVRNLEILVRRTFVPGNPDARRNLNKAFIARLPVLILVLAGVVLLGGRSAAFVVAFCGGLLLVQSSIVLRAVASLGADHLRTRK